MRPASTPGVREPCIASCSYRTVQLHALNQTRIAPRPLWRRSSRTGLRAFEDEQMPLTQSSIGPGGTRRRQRKPEWVRVLEEDADVDEDVAKVIRGTDGDPDKIRENIRQAMRAPEVFKPREGTDVPPRVTFRQVDPFGLWLWVQFVNSPLADERDMLEGLLRSWFVVGKVGGFNAQNMQMYNAAEDDTSFFDYDIDGAVESMSSFVHEIDEIEYMDDWARVRIDMGTADEIATDVLLNMLIGFSKEMVGLKAIVLGGQNEDWPVPEGNGAADEDGDDDDLFGQRGMDREMGDYMKVGMNPMKLPEGVEEELEWLEEEGLIGGGAGGGQGGGNSELDAELAQLAARLSRPEPGSRGGRGQGGREARNGDGGFDFGLGGGGDDGDGPSSAEPAKPWGSSWTRRVSGSEVRRRLGPPPARQ